MSENNSPQQALRPKNRMLGVAVFAFAALLLGVYAIVWPDGNDQVATDAAAPSSTQPVTAGADEAAPVLGKALSTGAMAAFVFKPDRPQIDLGEFKDGDGNVIDISKWKGRVALVNLWATWCGPCRAEMPHLNELQKLFGGQDFEVVALSVDLKGAEVSSAFLKDIKADHLALYIDQTTKVMGRIGAFGLPMTVLIDRQGREVGRLVGPADWAGADAQKIIKAAIAEKPGT